MQAKNIIAQSLGNLTGSFKSNSAVRQINSSGDFSKTMSDVQENQAKSSSQTVKSKTEMKDVSNNMKKLSDSNKPELDNGERLEVKPEVKEAMKAMNSDGKLKPAEEEMAVTLMSGAVLTPELLQQGAEQLEDKITELVTDVMGITEKELMELLENSGMQLMDLLNPDNLKQFVLQANGYEDAICLITNEKLANQYHDLLEGMANLELDENLGITKEEVASLLENAENSQDEEAVKTNSEEVTKSQHSGETETEPKIMVEKDTNSKDSKGFHEEARQDAKPMDVFVQNLAAKGTEGVQEAADQVQVMREIVDQIVEQIKIAIKPGATSMEVQLNPEHLGKVELTVVSKNGLLTASFTAENQIAKEAIESQIQVLKDNLNNQGVKVEAIEVNVSQFSFKQNTESNADTQGQSGQQKKSGSRRINLNYFDEDVTEVSEEEVLAAKVLKDNGGTVDYTA